MGLGDGPGRVIKALTVGIVEKSNNLLHYATAGTCFAKPICSKGEIHPAR